MARERGKGYAIGKGKVIRIHKQTQFKGRRFQDKISEDDPLGYTTTKVKIQMISELVYFLGLNVKAFPKTGSHKIIITYQSHYKTMYKPTNSKIMVI